MLNADVNDPVLLVEPKHRLLFGDVSVSCHGAIPSGKVIIEATFTDEAGLAWSSRGVYRADHDGKVDLARTASTGGTYTGVDADGLFWSMLPAPLDKLAKVERKNRFKENWPSFPGKAELKDMEISLTAQVETSLTTLEIKKAQASHRVGFLNEGVARQEIDEDGLRGVLYRPAGDGPHPAIVMVTGSIGGVMEPLAALLASHGYMSLALAYFKYPGRPKTLVNIPLEYFKSAVDWLCKKSGQDKVAILGRSRGAEGVLLTAAAFPDRIGAVLAIVPSNVAMMGCCESVEDYLSPAWTLEGKSFPHVHFSKEMVDNYDPDNPYPPGIFWRVMLRGMLDGVGGNPNAIQVEKIKAPILLTSGDADDVWCSSLGSRLIAQRLKEHGFKYPVRNLHYTGVGHYLPGIELVFSLSDLIKFKETEFTMPAGGIPELNARASKDAFCKMLDFLNDYKILR